MDATYITHIVTSQLGDPLRIGLLVALLFLAANSRGAANRWLPIALGLAFVAVVIPTAMASANATEPVGARIGIGFLTNTAVVALMLGAEAAYERFRPRKPDKRDPPRPGKKDE